MQFSQETDYALRLVEHFTSLGRDGYINAKELSETLSIPYRFLLRVLGKLKRGGILASRMGENGGYRLARTPAEISLRQIVTLIEGDVCLLRCLKDTKLCNAGLAPHCRVHKTLDGVRDQLNSLLEQYTFDNLTS